MNGVCGWLGTTMDAEDSRRLIASMTRMLGASAADVTSVHATAGFAAGGSARTAPVPVYASHDIVVAISGAPRLGDACAARKPGQDVASAIASEFRARGVECLSDIGGTFAVAVIDVLKGELTLAVDRMGVEALSYAVCGDTVVYGSAADAVNVHPAVRRTLDMQSIYDYVYFHVVPAPRSVFAEHRRVLPGQYVTVKGGHVESRSYWSMRYTEDPGLPPQALKSEFHALLRRAVGRTATGATGAFLSGGTDSSTVVGMLRETTGRRPRTYSIGFAAQGYDEMEYARIAARHFDADHHEYYVTPADVADSIPKIAGAYDQPFGNASAVPTYHCARVAREDGIEKLLGGDGGDELFGGNERYATQYIFSLYGRLPSALRRTVIEPVVFSMPRAEALGIMRKARGYIEKANVPMPARLETYNLLDRFGARDIFTADFLSGIDSLEPLDMLNAAYDNSTATSLINRMLALDLKHTLADNDLPKVTRMCDLAQVGVAFPMLDDELVAFSARLPSRLKLKGTRLRFFFKQALEGFLPAAILRKKKHGFGLPFGIWLQENRVLRDAVNASLSSLKRRDVIRPAFIDALIDVHVHDHPAYYGTMAWVLMMLEQWYQQHIDGKAA